MTKEFYTRTKAKILECKTENRAQKRISLDGTQKDKKSENVVKTLDLQSSESRIFHQTAKQCEQSAFHRKRVKSAVCKECV